MATGQISSVWHDGSNAYIAVEVEEEWDLEVYQATVPLSQLAGKTVTQRKTILRDAVKAVRDMRINPVVAISDISGTVEL